MVFYGLINYQYAKRDVTMWSQQFNAFACFVKINPFASQLF